MPILSFIGLLFTGPTLLQKLMVGVIGAAGLFLFGLYEGHSWTKAYEAAQYEKAKTAELAHQAQVEADFRVKEQDLIAKDQQLTDQLEAIKNEASTNSNSATVCFPPGGLRRLNEIR